MKQKYDPLSDGSRYLLQWDAPGTVGTPAGEQKSRMRGEAILVIRGDNKGRRGVSLSRFGLAGASVRSRYAETGVITVVGRNGTGMLKMTETEARVRIDLECTINYESLDAAHQRNTTAACYYQPATEPCGAVLEGTIALRGKALVLADARISVVCAAGEFEEVQFITIELGRLPMQPIAEPRARYRDRKPGAGDESNADDNVCIQVNRRRIVVQPVGFRASAMDASPSGSTSAAQLTTAQTVWGKCCIDIEIRPITFVINATLKTSPDVNAIRAAFTDGDPNVIEVFFVQNPLAAQGGGTAGGIGVASCKPVIAEPNAGNPVLVSHELGHVLGLLHPGGGSNSDANTVMTPTGGANNPGVSFVTHFMCTNIANPVIQTLPDLCCTSHDIGDHFIRDFPTDSGVEPSGPPPAGIYQYANSFVWNRQTNTPGTFNAVTGPEHQSPARYDVGMTPHTNYLFARVEQRNNLLVRNGVVKFYLKTPGSGGGAVNLTFLGQVNVPGSLAVGVPVDVVLPWAVPAGTPNHSCVFAVVRSDAEQEGDQSSLDWWAFENLAHIDNDWAQRNLDIEDYPSGNDGNIAYESAPFFIQIPPREDKQLRLTVEIDATRAAGLRELSVDVVGGRAVAGKPGGTVKVNLDLADRTEPYVLVVRGVLPPKGKPGTEFTVSVNPSVGERRMVGFATTLRVGSWQDVVAQTLDQAAAAFGDISSIVELPIAHELFCRIGTGCDRPYGLKGLARRAVDLRDLLERLADEIGGLSAVAATGAVTALKALLKTIEAYMAGGATDEEVIAALRAFVNRLMASACILHGKA